MRALLDNHVLALLSALTDATENLPTVDDPADSPVTIDAAFIERLTDAVLATAGDVTAAHGVPQEWDRSCSCGWPGVGREATYTALIRHNQTQRSAAVARWLAEHGILPAPPTLASLTDPDTVRVGHCALCGQTMIAARDHEPYHPHGSLHPCPEPPRGPDGQYVPGSSPEYLSWAQDHRENRPGAEHFVHDSATLYPDAPQ